MYMPMVKQRQNEVLEEVIDHLDDLRRLLLFNEVILQGNPFEEMVDALYKAVEAKCEETAHPFAAA